MSSRYPVLDNRPIDQWKVTELKEELRRRRLTTRGLKDDLIKRLDEDLRREAAEASEKDDANTAEASEKDDANGAKASEKDDANGAEASEKDDANGADLDPQPVTGIKESQMVTVVAEEVNTIETGSVKVAETAGRGNTGIVEPIERENDEKITEAVGFDSNKDDELVGVSIPVDVNISVPAMDQEEVGHKGLPAGGESESVGEDRVIPGSIEEPSIIVSGSVLKEVVVSGQDCYSMETQKENGDSATKLENDESKARLENEDWKSQLECDIEPQSKDLMPHSSAPENQVSEVNPILGSQVKSDSISTDCVSINEKNELKDNIIADNVKLELDNVRPEMLEPPSNNFVPVYGETHPMDVGDPHKKKTSIEEKSSNITSSDLNKNDGSEDVGYLEKLNLDRSSGDDSMEEDLPESKQFDSKLHAELRNKRESSEVPTVKEESDNKVVGDGVSAGKGDTHQDNDIHLAVPVGKRKFTDHALLGNNEPAKRLRRWNSETVKGRDPQSASHAPATTPKDEPIALKRNFSMFDSSAIDDAPKERIVPPSQRSPTKSLRIDRFLRPFTLKAVQELLGKTGEVISFWMDQIKTHCYVTYSSVEQAIETRNAVYNLQWPPNGGRLLVAEFVDPEEVKMKFESPPVQAASASSGPIVPPTPPTSHPEPSPRQFREQHPVPATLPPPPPLSKPPPAARERLPSPPPLPEKGDPPIVTLDDLFRKTRATPRIYYLPLSEEQVAAKLATQGKSTKQ